MTTTMPNQFELKRCAYASNLKSRALNVFLYLVDRTNKELTCFPSIATIGKQLHISLSTVKRAIKELLEKGFLKREARFSEKKNGGQTSNLYTLSKPDNAPAKLENEDKSEDINKNDATDNTEKAERKLQDNAQKQVQHITFESILKEKKEEEKPNLSPVIELRTDKKQTDSLTVSQVTETVTIVENNNHSSKLNPSKKLFHNLKYIISNMLKGSRKNDEDRSLSHMDGGGGQFATPLNLSR